MTSLLSVDAETAKRSYAASAYLEPNLDRKNLLVLTEAYVTKVLHPPLSLDPMLICNTDSVGR